MSAIIKGGNGNNFVYSGKVSISNEIKEDTAIRREQVNPFLKGITPNDIKKSQQTQQNPIPAPSPAPQHELDALRQHYINEGQRQAEQLTARANQEAADIAAKSSQQLIEAQEQAKKLLEEAHDEGMKLHAEAKEKGYNAGFSQGTIEGEKKGYDEGYLNGLKKCKDTLLELKAMTEELSAQKAHLMQIYEHQLFDTIFEIAQKITINSLKQKDKAVLQKMLKETAKEFRSAKTVKITLSQLDVSEDAEMDFEQLKSVFSSSTNVEFEVLSDAESGTLIVDNGSEIVDASVSTQLKMIEELGRGKYRDKKSLEPVQEEEIPVPKVEAEQVDEKEEEAAEITEEIELEEEAPVIEETAVSEEAVEKSDEMQPLEPAEMGELTLIDDSGAETTADSLEQKSAKAAAEKQKAEEAELKRFEQLENEHQEALEKEKKRAKPKADTAEKSPSKRPRKPTNPLLSKMIDNLGE